MISLEISITKGPVKGRIVVALGPSTVGCTYAHVGAVGVAAGSTRVGLAFGPFIAIGGDVLLASFYEMIHFW